MIRVWRNMQKHQIWHVRNVTPIQQKGHKWKCKIDTEWMILTKMSSVKPLNRPVAKIYKGGGFNHFGCKLALHKSRTLEKSVEGCKLPSRVWDKDSVITTFFSEVQAGNLNLVITFLVISAQCLLVLADGRKGSIAPIESCCLWAWRHGKWLTIMKYQIQRTRGHQGQVKKCTKVHNYKNVKFN